MTIDMTTQPENVAHRARAFAKEHLDAIASTLDHTGIFPKAVVDDLAAHGFLGLVMPEEWDGSGFGFIDYVDVVQTFSRSCPAIASILNGHVLAACAIAGEGYETQKRRYLPALAKGEWLGAVAIFETGPLPGTGPEALIATREGDTFRLNGMKAFVRNAGVAEVYVVFATLRQGTDQDGFVAFLLDAGTQGLTVGPRLDTMGLNGCPVAHLTFENVKLTKEAMLGKVDAGSAIARRLLALSAVLEAAQTVGIAQAAASHAAGYARHRVQFRHPIADLDAVQTMLAEIATDSYLAWLGVQHAARLIDSGAPFAVEAAMVKAFLARFGSKMLIDACQVEGGLGISESAPKGIRDFLPLARLFRDIAGTTLLDAPADVPDKVIAESIV